jgi:hypothetical protein
LPDDAVERYKNREYADEKIGAYPALNAQGWVRASD